MSSTEKLKCGICEKPLPKNKEPKAEEYAHCFQCDTAYQVMRFSRSHLFRAVAEHFDAVAPRLPSEKSRIQVDMDTLREQQYARDDQFWEEIDKRSREEVDDQFWEKIDDRFWGEIDDEYWEKIDVHFMSGDAFKKLEGYWDALEKPSGLEFKPEDVLTIIEKIRTLLQNEKFPETGDQETYKIRHIGDPKFSVPK